MRQRASIRVLTILAACSLGAAVVASCGGDDAADTTTSTTAAPVTTAPADTTTEPPPTTTEAPPTTTEPPPTTTEAPPTTTEPPVEDILAIWPAADVVFSTPEAAAEDFLANAFDPGPVLGEFQAGDARSGEFEVFATAEDPETPIGEPRSVLIMRQLGADQGWFVMSAIHGSMTIEQPEMGAEVAAGPVDVSGVAQGFEATVIVEAFVVGSAEPLLDQEVTMAGNFGVSEPYSVTLDLSAAPAGSTVVILLRGGVGLETDPGDFSAIPIVIAG